MDVYYDYPRDDDQSSSFLVKNHTQSTTFSKKHNAAYLGFAACGALLWYRVASAGSAIYPEQKMLFALAAMGTMALGVHKSFGSEGQGSLLSTRTIAKLGDHATFSAERPFNTKELSQKQMQQAAMYRNYSGFVQE